MPTTVSISLASISGEAGPFTLFLRKTSDKSLVNADGDALTEVEVDTVKTGVWTATVAETIPAEDCLARIYEGTTEDRNTILIDSILYSGQTEIGKQAGNGGGLTPEESETLDSIAIALAGSAPVEPTGASDTVMARLTRIESAVLLANTTIATLASQTSFTLTAGSADNDAYTGQTVVITDQATATQKAVVPIADYVGSTRTITLKSAPVFTIAVGDVVSIIAGSAGGSQAVTLQLGATIPLTLGQVTGLTQDLVVGNSYTEELGTRIPVTLTDASGDPIAVTFGNRDLSDADCTIKCVLHPINARNTDNVTAAAQGICEFVPASGGDPASLWIELPGTETTRLTPGVYSVQFHAVWDDGNLVSLAWKGTCKFVRIIRPKS